MKIALLILALALTGCATPECPQTFSVSINGKPTQLQSGAKIIMRDARTGRFVPLRIESERIDDGRRD